MNRILPVRRSHPSIAARGQQRGIALLVVLVLLLIMTLLGLASLRGTMLEERMSGNLFDRSLSFQAAETALRQGEAVAANPATVIPAGSNCNLGVCGPPTTGLDRSLGTAGWVNATRLTGDETLAVLNANDLKYLVEYLGEYNTSAKCDQVLGPNGKPSDPLCKSKLFRISAKYEANGRASILLQSALRIPSP